MPLEIVEDQETSAFARAQTGLLFNLPVPPDGAAQLPSGVSLCMIVRNEERFLEACLASVRDAVDEINIVDTGSTDRTVEIARSFGANVEVREWRDDFGWARNESLAMATRRWTLVLDADEELAPESVPLLRALRETPAAEMGVYVQIQNAVDDLSGSVSTMTHMLPRIFPTSPRIRYRNVIHENLMLDDDRHVVAAVSPIVVRHKGYTTEVMDAREKNARNRPLLERAMREAADDSFSWFNFGVAAIAAGDYETGIDVLDRMFAMPGPRRLFFPIAAVMLAHAYGDGRGDVERALAIVEAEAEVTPDHANVIFTRGNFLARQRRFDEARAAFERALEVRDRAANHVMVDDEIFTWKAAVNIASSYTREERFEEAVPWFERALDGKPGSATLRTLLANAYEKVGRFYDAERIFRELAHDGGAAGFIEHVNYLMRRRRFAEAFERVEHNRAAVPDDAYVSLLLSAAVTTRDERLGDAEPHALRALEIQPGNGFALALLQSLYESRGEDAKAASLRAAELDAPLRVPSDFARRSHRLLEEGRLGDALTTARAGLDVSPDDPVLAYNAALAAARMHDDAAALALLDRITADDRHAASALALRAEIERRGGDLDAALATVERLAALPARDAAVVDHASMGLARALLEAGRLSDAGRVAELALR